MKTVLTTLLGLFSFSAIAQQNPYIADASEFNNASMSAAPVGCNHDTDPRLPMVHEDILDIAMCSTLGHVTHEQGELWWDSMAAALRIGDNQLADYFMRYVVKEYEMNLANSERWEGWSVDSCNASMLSINENTNANVESFHKALITIGGRPWQYTGIYSDNYDLIEKVDQPMHTKSLAPHLTGG